MTEPKQEYKTERKEPPNLREVKCCASCNRFYFSFMMGNGCSRYGDIGLETWNTCDDYEPAE